MAANLPGPLPGKKLIICCDGTWLNADNGVTPDSLFENGRVQIPSNVTRLCRSIQCITDEKKVPQVVYYQAGVGTGNSWWDKVVGGGTGMGLSENIREAYTFIADNYAAGDQIFLVGFSRGAFTARSIAGLIGTIGLLTKKGLCSFYEIFKDYENSWDTSYKPQNVNVPYPNKCSILDPQYATEMEKRNLTRLNIPVKAIAVWDTVGSLGIPSIGWLNKLGITPQNREYSFYDTKLGNHIEYAFQALALDEERSPFSPAVWERPAGNNTKLKQCWFPGVHSDVGGGYDDAEISNITLAWMMSQLDHLIDFEETYIPEAYQQNQEYYKAHRQTPRGWAKGLISNSSSGIRILGGKTVRTPGQYRRSDPHTSKRTDQLLEDTNEHIHASVRIRYGQPGLGVEDHGPYRPESLEHWGLLKDLKKTATADVGPTGPIQTAWEFSGKQDSLNLLPEDEIGEVEKRLLRFDKDAWQKVMGTPMRDES